MTAAVGDYLADALEGREALSAALRAARARAGEDESWLSGAVALLDSNAGEAALLAFLALVGRGSLRGVGEAAALVCREAGARACVAALEGWEQLHRPDWWSTLARLAREASDCVGAAIEHAGEAMREGDVAGFAEFVATGLRAFATSPARRARYFRLEEPLARQTLSHALSGELLARERQLRLFIAALTGATPPLRAHPIVAGRPPPRRVSVIDGVILMPETFAGAPPGAQDRLFLAAAAHAAAHLMFGHGRQKIGSLKPLQLAVIGLIEDARVEALAIRRYPGLARLWAPFHVARAEGGACASLLARISRALIDPAFDDAGALTVKARALFAEADLEDGGMARRIGGLLGNDIGQMRVQFNARSWVIEPSYRDDNLGLWDYGDQADQPAQELDIEIEAARLRREQGDEQGKSDATPCEDHAKARPRAPNASEGVTLGKYPEWDEATGRERPEWTTVIGVPAAPGAAPETSIFESGERDAARRILGLAKSAELGRRVRERRRLDGDRLDLDACVGAIVERRINALSEARVFVSHKPGPRSLAVLLLIDLSQSTGDAGADGRRVLDAERQAADILAAVLDQSRDALAIHGFHSDGRERILYRVLKDFHEPYDALVRARLSGLVSEYSTRLGAAIRHAASELARQRAFRRVLLVLTDGEPSDIDVTDPAYLVADARHAAQAAKRNGIDVFAMGLGSGAFESLNKIVGAARTLPIPTLGALPGRVAQLYRDLKK